MTSVIQRLEDAADQGVPPGPVAREVVALLREVRGYLIAAAEGSMSRNNSEQLASELLQRMDT